MKNDLYRLNAATVVFNKQGKVLICSRVDFENQWQFPQGGINNEENHQQAALRELREETNIFSVKHASYPTGSAISPHSIHVDAQSGLLHPTGY